MDNFLKTHATSLYENCGIFLSLRHEKSLNSVVEKHGDIIDVLLEKLSADSINIICCDNAMGTESIIRSYDSIGGYGADGRMNEPNFIGMEQGRMRGCASGGIGDEHITWESDEFCDIVEIILPKYNDFHYLIRAKFQRHTLFDREYYEFKIRSLYPILGEYLNLWDHYRAEQQRADHLTALLDISNVAIILLDVNHSIIFANNVAWDIINREDGIMSNGSLLTTFDNGQALSFHTTIDHIIGLSVGKVGSIQSKPRRAAMVSITRPAAPRPLILTIIPPEKSPESSTDPAVIICGLAADGDVRQALVPVCKLYSLSPAETRLVCSLTEGLTLAEAAKQNHIQFQTVRTYLKQIFQKTNTNRQADLIRIMLSSLLRMRSDITIE